MVLIDSSVWIDHFSNYETPHVQKLRDLILDRGSVILTGDLILVEVLQGTRNQAQFEFIMRTMKSIPQIAISDPDIAILAARNYRLLRARGITPRKTIDTLIATRCIMNGLALLTSDRDFAPFQEHLGLRLA